MTDETTFRERRPLSKWLREEQRLLMEDAERLRGDVARLQQEITTKLALIASQEERAVECMVAANMLDDRNLRVGRTDDGSVLVTMDPVDPPPEPPTVVIQ